jgi:sigma-B regulation protein RsbQ
MTLLANTTNNAQADAAAVLARHAVRVTGDPDGPPLLFAHGFGCDQAMWRHVAPAFEADHRVIVFDHAGSGDADPAVFSPERYASLHDYADDVLAICAALDLRDVTFVGHSVSAMIGVLAASAEPERFASLVLIGPSPRYVDEEGYEGGFSAADIDGLLATMEIDYLGWSSTMAPMIVGNADRPELGAELEASFCRTDPAAARHFGRLTFLSDNRADLPGVRVPTLILQCREDMIASPVVGAYVHRAIAGSELVVLDATGHCPHISAPALTIEAIRAHLER